MSWRGNSRGGFNRGGSNDATSSSTRGATRGSSRGSTSSSSRGAAGAVGKNRNVSWRAERRGDEMDAVKSPLTVFGGDPSAFGTPTFSGDKAGSSDSSRSLKIAEEEVLERINVVSSSARVSPLPGMRLQDVAMIRSNSAPDTYQISTLEVLGEDSEGRRKRFESTLSNNRYLEVRSSPRIISLRRILIVDVKLKPLREAQRISDIRRGLIPDPLKAMRLDEATDFAGTCNDMCPEWEREEREYQKNVDLWERVCSHSLAIDV